MITRSFVYGGHAIINRLLFITLSLFVVIGCANKADIHRESASISMKRGDINLAVEEYSKAIAINPNNENLYYDRGVAYLRKMRMSANNNSISDYYEAANNAISDYSKAIDINPEFVHAYYNRSSAYCGIKKYDLAIADCTIAINLKPSCIDGYIQRSVAYQNMGDYERALRDCAKTIELEPNSAAVYTNRGAIYSLRLRKGDSNLAKADYNKALELDPDGNWGKMAKKELARYAENK
jgi:tetratricopeptide (TPR) repeat protein